MPITPDELWGALTEEDKAAIIAKTKPSPLAIPEEPDEIVEGELVEDYAELDSFLEDFLRVSFKGVHYDIPAADVQTGLLCQRLMGAGARARAGRQATQAQQEQLDDAEETELFIDLLGGRQTMRVTPLSVACPECGALPNKKCTEEADGEELEQVPHRRRGEVPHPRYDPAHDVWQQLQDEDRSWPFVQHIGTTAIFWAAFGEEMALEFWRSGGRPKAPPAPEPNRAERRARKGTANKTR
jgi:hypothetical protein